MKTIIQLIIGIAVCLGLAWLLEIRPETDYGWFMGAVHGVLLVPNWIISLFDSSWLIKATQYTSTYNVMWWVFGVLNILYWIWVLVGAGMAIAKSLKKQ